MPCEISQIVKQIPLYRELYGPSIEAFDLASNYHAYPPIEKSDVARNFPNNWMTESLRAAVKNGEVEYNASSGTTSERMQIVRKPKWWAFENRSTYAFDERLAKLNTDSHRKMVLTTAICSNTVCFAKLPSLEERIMGQTLYLNISPDPNSWQQEDIERMVDEINHWKPHIFDVDPVYFALFCKLKGQFGLRTTIHRPDIIIYTYEYVTRFAKAMCDEHFPYVPTIEFYGSTETGYNLFSTPSGGYFHVQDRCFIDCEHVERDIYSIKITSWKNRFMPLVNYRIKDLCRLSEEEAKPTRERNGQPLRVKQLCGRLFDTAKGRNNSLITVGDIELALSPLALPISLYQLRFLGEELCQFKYVSKNSAPLSQQEEALLREVLIPLLRENTALRFSSEKSISPEISGKFAVIKKG
ncbi:MAG TPA: hypothetical protein VEL47_04190 [Myxococcota bacterium]|nr:hypothetical protein [Myxococcota bacterium]